MTENFIATEQVKLRIDQYFQAVFHADLTLLKEIFHPQAAMYGYLGELLLAGSPEPFFADLASKPSMATNQDDCRAVVIHLQVTGKIANATMLVDGFYGAACIEDHFHLINENGQWYIVCKTFTTL